MNMSHLMKVLEELDPIYENMGSDSESFARAFA
jgi:hypothetical protein